MIDRPGYGRRAALVLAAVVVAGSSALTSASVPSVTAANAPAEADPEPMRDAAQQVLGAGAPGYVARIEDGHGVWYTLAGLADRSTGRKLTAEDQFEVGSITKMFTATLILQLADERQLDLDGPVSDYLPGVVPNGKQITVRMLLNHTSGVFNYTADEAFFTTLIKDPQRNWTTADFLDIAFRAGPNFAPGTTWSYSNTNYVLAGMILEKLTGRSVADLVQQRIANPLGLKHTYLAEPRATDTGPGYAHGYAISYSDAGTTYEDTASWPTGGWGGADGAILSTSDDLSRFLSAVLGGKLFSGARLQEMKTTVSMPARFHSEDAYGLGLFKYVSPCGPVWGHDGATLSHRSTAFATEDGKRTAVSDITARPIDLDEIPGPHVQRFDQVAAAVQDATVCTMLGKPLPPAVTAALHSTTYLTAP